MERILTENESIQNQLSISAKVKQSLESELVKVKLTHAEELQGLIKRFAQAEKALHQKESEKELLSS